MKEAAILWVSHHGYVGIFSLLVLGIVGLPVPDEWLLTLAGYLVFKGTLAFAPTLAAAFLGSVCGITLSFILGRTFGTFLLVRYGLRFGIGHGDVERVHGWFRRIGRWALTFGYFVPGVRHLTAYVAGATELEIPVFAAYAYTGGFIWSLTFILAGYYLGEQWTRISESLHSAGLLTAVVVSAIVIVWFFRRRRRNGAFDVNSRQGE
jgi:membrane protein DedA with SNARE-associated domain